MSTSDEAEPGSVGNQLEMNTHVALKSLSRAMLSLHKSLLDQAKAEYEAKYGKIQNVSTYFQLVIDDPHFAWLRKISALVALIDEAVSIRRKASETEALALLAEARILLNFDDADEDFNDKFQTALQNNPDAVLRHNAALKFVDSA